MLLKLFLTFFEIGAVSFGGGYGMISLIPVSYTHLDVYKRQLLYFLSVMSFLSVNTFALS